jgi:4-hydroxy-4-methyl-2-oxoglutarate aldolase
MLGSVSFNQERKFLNQATYERIEKLKVPVADLSDGCRHAGFATRVADRSMRPGVPFSRLAGTAVTVREYLADGEADYSLQIADVYDLGRSVPRAVLVMKNEVPGFTAMGSGGARVAQAHGYVGCVVDGPIRDTQELVELGFPVFGTSIRADSLAVHMMPQGRSIHLEIGKPVTVGSITISPGDIVVGDNDGLIAIASDQLPAALAEAEKIVGAEALIFSLLAEGKTFREILGILAQRQSG